MTMTLISTVTVGAGGAASIDFTSIPQTGTDLLVVFSGRDTASGVVWGINCIFNNDSTTANYNNRFLYGTGSGVGSSSNANYTLSYVVPGLTATAGTFSSTTICVPNYAGSTAKSFSVDSVMENNATQSYQDIFAGLWNSSAAINRVTLTAAGTFAQYSTASLYTITKGSGGATVS